MNEEQIRQAAKEFVNGIGARDLMMRNDLNVGFTYGARWATSAIWHNTIEPIDTSKVVLARCYNLSFTKRYYYRVLNEMEKKKAEGKAGLSVKIDCETWVDRYCYIEDIMPEGMR